MQMRLFGEPSRAGHALHGGPAGHERMDVFFVGFLRRPRPLALGRSASRLVMGWWLLGVGSGRAARRSGGPPGLPSGESYRLHGCHQQLRLQPQPSGGQ
jgi:hypothetical protein